MAGDENADELDECAGEQSLSIAGKRES